ncbi:UDP-N-acetylmuramoyl-L-alanyl-D-glutamate--2,6-diaminopimelate ligase [Sphingorhabdus pulchriflava]|uniref:UDP-N-acetylmuramoyl-L-alanyl-D-glutamate--2,6-diaminopimelate ligase n=1 Tax=Sphingorhabdus pulchriflava TaxID=2292257 RepID=A0A371BFZ9_9SPHN|nr:UDP-N-acetylmuramoyl-L-alanyl-D-glutamate--2,6-diaminopimelate ligase [Sphingorhabdus pulchriflava]RDV06524.1 UDP-N-acetylmuramoyl-L-alanyl-D-glutamate--2,6-diaminopimelate ligase [Sphingorhabdus pulchriflava]
MRLDSLIGEAAGVSGGEHVTGFAIDHRKIAPGTIFGAFQGAAFNGEDFISAAIEAGAVAIVARPEAQVDGAVHIADANPRKAFAMLASRFYAPFPAHVAAVTGTNGKTSTAEMTRQLWRMDGHSAASIGTLGITTADEQVRTGLTTPDIVTYLSNMAGLEREGVTHAIFEASSHGLDQYRIAGVPVSVVAFTNLSRDHLDYHGSMDAYFEAKMRLFDEIATDNATAVIWADDDWSEKAIARAKERPLRLITVGAKGHGIQLLSREPTQLGQTLEISMQGEVSKVKLPLIGGYQVANALLSAGIAIASGCDAEAVIANLARLQPVRGRLERAAISRSGAPVYVDYAHTPDGLEAAIAALRPHTKGKLILVFGAGGDRDAGKRPLMGEIAARDADVVIVTDDNPRTEDPASIRQQVIAGASGAHDIGDRRLAIAAAIRQAEAEDIVMIAGKGHELGQIIGDKSYPFDDVEVARECAA